MSKQLTATGVFSDGSVQEMTSAVVWSSSDASVATVSSTGLATALAIGTSTITATTGAISGSSSLSVISASLVSIAVSPSSVTIAKGTSFQFTLYGTFSDGSTQALIARNWKSSAPNLSSIRRNGLVRGKRPGSATITASYGGLCASATMTVSSAKMLSMVLSPVDPSIAAHTEQQFQALGLFEGGFTQDVTVVAHWTSSNPAAATVSNSFGSDGLATSFSSGTSAIMASISSVEGSTVLTVTNATLVSVAVTPTNPAIVLGRTQQFVATGSFSDNAIEDISNSVTWTSSQPAVAVIGSGGLATSAGVGITTISASSGAITGSTLVEVE